MNVARFISERITSTRSKSFTASVTKIAIISIALGLAVMIVSFAILEGFRKEIQDKIFSFGAHLTITKYDLNNSLETYPIAQKATVDKVKNNKFVAHVQSFARKTAIIKTDEEVLGVVLKGVEKGYDLSPFKKNLLDGEPISFADTASTGILISKKISDKLKLGVGDRVLFYFIQNPPKARKLQVKGIFNTGLEEFDEIFVIGDLQMLREVNEWPDSLVSGYEVILKDFKKIDRASEDIFEDLSYDLNLMKITDQHAQLFEWLSLLKRNVVIFLALIIFVAVFNMVSSVFIMIMERTHMIGVLKALGASDRKIREIFFYKGLKLTLTGLALGNILGIGFCAVQYYFKLIPLNAENYYMDTVPIYWNFPVILGTNITIFVFTMVAIYLPSFLVSRINPISAIRFD